jgi:hypothetical protein
VTSVGSEPFQRRVTESCFETRCPLHFSSPPQETVRAIGAPSGVRGPGENYSPRSKGNCCRAREPGASREQQRQTKIRQQNGSEPREYSLRQNCRFAASPHFESGHASIRRLTQQPRREKTLLLLEHQRRRPRRSGSRLWSPSTRLSRPITTHRLANTCVCVTWTPRRHTAGFVGMLSDLCALAIAEPIVAIAARICPALRPLDRQRNERRHKQGHWSLFVRLRRVATSPSSRNARNSVRYRRTCVTGAHFRRDARGRH